MSVESAAQAGARRASGKTRGPRRPRRRAIWCSCSTSQARCAARAAAAREDGDADAGGHAHRTRSRRDRRLRRCQRPCLPSTPGDARRTSMGAIRDLDAGGSTNGAEGISWRTDTAACVVHQERRQPGHPRHRRRLQYWCHQPGRARATDRAAARAGDLPVRPRGGRQQPEGLHDGEAGRQGQWQLRVSRLSAGGATRADREAGATLVTVAKDVKIQVEFNPRVVERISADRLREPAAEPRRLQRRRGGRRRDRRRAQRHCVVRVGSFRRAGRQSHRGPAEVPGAVSA